MTNEEIKKVKVSLTAECMPSKIEKLVDNVSSDLDIDIEDYVIHKFDVYDDLSSIFAKKIKSHYVDNLDLIQALVYADSKQVGKSVFMLKTMYLIYQDWDKVFDNLFFKPVNFVEYCRRLNNAHKKVPVIGFDDAGVHSGSDLYFRDKRAYFDLGKVVQTIGTVCTCLLVSAPSTGSPVAKLTDDRNCTVKIVKTDKYMRKARVFAKNELPWGKTLDKEAFFDNFNVLMDDKPYNRYEKKRQNLTGEALSGFLDSVDAEPDMMEIPEI